MENMLMYNSNFEHDKKIGKIGETAVINFFIGKGYEVKDVSENKEYQPKGVDLIVNNDYVEVKTQNAINKKQRITLELESFMDNGDYKPGWFTYTESDMVVFYDKFNNIAYHIETDELKDIFYLHSDKIETYDFKEKGKTSKLAFIDIDFLKKVSKTLKTYNYNFFTA